MCDAVCFTNVLLRLPFAARPHPCLLYVSPPSDRASWNGASGKLLCIVFVCLCVWMWCDSTLQLITFCHAVAPAFWRWTWGWICMHEWNVKRSHAIPTHCRKRWQEWRAKVTWRRWRFIYYIPSQHNFGMITATTPPGCAHFPFPLYQTHCCI